MDEKRLYLIALPDEETDRSLTAIHAALRDAGICANSGPDFPFHLTLADFTISEEAEALGRAREVCSRTPAFDLQLTNLGLFGLKVLFIAPAPSLELITLHHALAPDTTHAWVPHITMMLDMPEEAVLEAVKVVADTFTPSAARFSRVAAYEFSPEKRVATFELIPHPVLHP